MRYFIWKLCLAASTVPDLDFGIGATAKTFLFESKQQELPGCEADSRGVAKIMLSLLQVF